MLIYIVNDFIYIYIGLYMIKSVCIYVQSQLVRASNLQPLGYECDTPTIRPRLPHIYTVYRPIYG